MLEMISALRINNAQKIPKYDPSLLEHSKKLLCGLVHSTGIYVGQCGQGVTIVGEGEKTVRVADVRIRVACERKTLLWFIPKRSS